MRTLSEFGVPLSVGKSFFHTEIGKWAALYNGKIIGTFIEYRHAYDLCQYIDWKTTTLIGMTGDNADDLYWDWDFIKENRLRLE